ncbi:MAG: GIY-YIG nuclease family protein [Gammaproteobacteria bacterium]|nr:GIY-YIG nuclease family protein [Gammaproteobacteria bacterium]
MLTNNDKGTYILILQALKRVRCEVGRLGVLDSPKGFYIYIGSAFGPGGVAARVKRHLNKRHRVHWHLDYLSPYVQAQECWYTFDAKKREHQWAHHFFNVFDSHLPLLGFGCSDCHCQSHLFYLSAMPEFNVFEKSCLMAINEQDTLYRKQLIIGNDR